MPSSEFKFHVRIPVIRDFKLLGRTDPIWGGSLNFTFHPPASIDDWPKRIAEVGDTILRSHLSPYFGSNARGIEVDGRIYTNDLPFWLSILKSGGQYNVVYDTSDTLWGQFQKFFYGRFRSRGPEVELWQELSPNTALEFTNIDEWEALKQKNYWSWYYQSDFVSTQGEEAEAERLTTDATVTDVMDPPPPYDRGSNS